MKGIDEVMDEGYLLIMLWMKGMDEVYG